MTQSQKLSIDRYRNEFEEKCRIYAAWGSARDCSFRLLGSDSEEDKNITMLITTITGISDDNQTYVETLNLMVEPDGNVLNLYDVFPMSEVVGYIETLKRID